MTAKGRPPLTEAEKRKRHRERSKERKQMVEDMRAVLPVMGFAASIITLLLTSEVVNHVLYMRCGRFVFMPVGIQLRHENFYLGRVSDIDFGELGGCEGAN